MTRIGPIEGPDTINVYARAPCPPPGTGCDNGTPITTLVEGRLDGTNTTQNLPADGSFNPIRYQTLTINTGGFTATGVPNWLDIQVPFTGWYNIEGRPSLVTGGAGSPQIWMQIRVNGVAVRQIHTVYPNGLYYLAYSLTIYGNSIYLTAGDIVSLYIAGIQLTGPFVGEVNTAYLQAIEISS